MNRNIRHLHASTGLEMLKSSVLLVLYENKDVPYGEAGCLLQPKAIAEQLGIQRPSQVSAQAYALIFGVLDHPREEGYVCHVEHCGWIITQDGVEAVEK